MSHLMVDLFLIHLPSHQHHSPFSGPLDSQIVYLIMLIRTLTITTVKCPMFNIENIQHSLLTLSSAPATATTT